MTAEDGREGIALSRLPNQLFRHPKVLLHLFLRERERELFGMFRAGGYLLLFRRILASFC